MRAKAIYLASICSRSPRVCGTLECQSKRNLKVLEEAVKQDGKVEMRVRSLSELAGLGDSSVELSHRLSRTTSNSR